MTSNSLKSLPFLIYLSFLPFPATTQEGTTIIRGPTSEYGFMEVARFPDCGVGGAGAFLNTTAYNRAECGIRCLMDDDCLSFEFGMENETCSLFDYSALPHLTPKVGIVFADSVDPKVGEQHPCDDDPCLSGNICTEECHPNGFKCQCPPGLQGDTCNELAPVDGGFSPWGNYSECSDVCRAVSYRNCSNPWPVGEGKDCVGPNTRETQCASEDCSVFPYVGCYRHNQLETDYDISLEKTSSDMTISLCRDECSYRGYKLVALKGQKCYCIRSAKATDDFDESKCFTDCPGDSSQACGGNWYSSVYNAGSSYYGTSYKGCFTGLTPSGKVIQTYIPVIANPPSTTPPSNSSTTTLEPPSTTPAYLGLTARECIEDCRKDGYLFASLFNETTCHCHNSLEGMDMSYSEGACDMVCPGGDDMGKYCGGSQGYSTFHMNIEATEFWSEWFNFDTPWADGHDIETTAEVFNTMPWICPNPVDIQCRTFDDIPHDQSGDKFNVNCTIAGGINCTQDLQVYYVNVTFNVSDWRLVEIKESYNTTELNCEWVTISANDTELNGTFVNGTVTGGSMINSTMVNETMVNGTMVNGTMVNNTLMGTNGTGIEYGQLICNNETMVLEHNVTVNETYIRLTWRLDKMSPQCQDYKFRFKCRNEPQKLIGCFEAGDVNDTSTVNIGLDVANCSAYCRDLGYPLLGLSSEDNRCSCGSSMKNIKVFASQCFHTCGTEGYPCGGIGKQSVYYAGDCNLPFGVTKSQMSGTLMHNNDATDEYDLWFEALDQNPTIELSNFTNIGVNIPFELEIDLGQVRTFNRMETAGMYISGIDAMTGVTQFRVGYKLGLDHDTELVTERESLTAKEFSVSSISGTTSHAMGQMVTARYVTIYVDNYDMFPGIKVEMYGCADG